MFAAVPVVVFCVGCGVKTEYLPQVAFPYLAEMEFLKEVKNVNGKARKRRFKDDRITSPFYFLLQVKEIENNGVITVRFYDAPQKDKSGKSPGPGRTVMEKRFEFGKPGKYYEYIIFFDRVEGLPPGPYRYTVFYNDRLIYDDKVEIKE